MDSLNIVFSDIIYHDDFTKESALTRNKYIYYLFNKNGKK